jgi:hypothetical protein
MKYIDVFTGDLLITITIFASTLYATALEQTQSSPEKDIEHESSTLVWQRPRPRTKLNPQTSTHSIGGRTRIVKKPLIHSHFKEYESRLIFEQGMYAVRSV